MDCSFYDFLFENILVFYLIVLPAWPTATMISTPYYELNLAMTRSLGDFYIGAYGCSSEPTIIQSKLDSDIQIVCASDGIWDNWKIEDFREFLYTTNFEETFEKSVELAKNNFGRSHDDMTLMEFRFI